jgi:hypothetical protein
MCPHTRRALSALARGPPRWVLTEKGIQQCAAFSPDGDTTTAESTIHEFLSCFDCIAILLGDMSFPNVGASVADVEEQCDMVREETRKHPTTDADADELLRLLCLAVKHNMIYLITKCLHEGWITPETHWREASEADFLTFSMFSPVGVLVRNPDREAALKLLTAQFLLPRWRMTRAGDEKFTRLVSHFEENPDGYTKADERHAFLLLFRDHEEGLKRAQFPNVGAALHDLVYQCNRITDDAVSQLQNDPTDLLSVVSYHGALRDRLPVLLGDCVRDGWIERDTRWEALGKEEVEALIKKHAVYVKK